MQQHLSQITLYNEMQTKLMYGPLVNTIDHYCTTIEDRQLRAIIAQECSEISPFIINKIISTILNKATNTPNDKIENHIEEILQLTFQMNTKTQTPQI